MTDNELTPYGPPTREQWARQVGIEIPVSNLHVVDAVKAELRLSFGSISSCLVEANNELLEGFGQISQWERPGITEAKNVQPDELKRYAAELAGAAGDMSRVYLVTLLTWEHLAPHSFADRVVDHQISFHFNGLHQLTAIWEEHQYLVVHKPFPVVEPYRGGRGDNLIRPGNNIVPGDSQKMLGGPWQIAGDVTGAQREEIMGWLFGAIHLSKVP